MNCDQCDRPATHCAQDFRQLEPLRADDGSLYAVWEPCSEFRWGCDEHPVQGLLYLLSGEERVMSSEKGEGDG